MLTSLCRTLALVLGGLTIACGQGTTAPSPSASAAPEARHDSDGQSALASQAAYGSWGLDLVNYLALDPAGEWLLASLDYPSQALLVFAVDDAGARLTLRQRLDVQGSATWLWLDPSGRWVFNQTERTAAAQPGELRLWAFDRRSGELRAANGSPLRGDDGEVLNGAFAVDPSGRFAYAATRRADGTARVLPFVLDAEAGSATPFPAGAQSLPDLPRSLSFVPAER